MGLWISYDCYDGTCTNFGRWRRALVEAAGKSFTAPPIEIRRNADCGVGRWHFHPEEPLWILVVHADTEGFIHPSEMHLLIKRLQKLLPKLSEEHKERTERFIKGLGEALKDNSSVEFH